MAASIEPSPPAPLLGGKRILVTGGSRGLGRAFCEHFARQGADVAFNYTADDDAAEETLQRIRDAGQQGERFKVSVLDAAGLNRMVRELEKAWGGIDVLVNNAGINQTLPFALIEEEDWDRVLTVNLKGQYLAARAVLRGMLRRRAGAILNIGSIAGVRSIESPVHYAASKAAVKGFTESLCKDVAGYNIRVNCLAPGLLEDGISRALPDYRVEEYLTHASIKRKATFAEVAAFAAFLVSDRNRYMNGATLVMDGGL